MRVDKLLITLGAFAKKNSPAILTGVSIAAGGIAVVLGMVGQHKADEDISKMPESDQNDFKKTVKKTWKHYVPAAAAYGVSVAASIGGYKQAADRYKALLAASAMSNDKISEAVNTVEEKLGIKKDEKSSNEEGKDRSQKVIFTETKQWFKDPVTGTSFRTAPSDIFRSCLRETTEALLSDGWVSIKAIVEGCDDVEYDNDYVPDIGEYIGWQLKDGESFEPVLTNGYVRKDGTPCVRLEFSTPPHSKVNQTYYKY